MSERAYSFDLDGVIFGRIPLQTNAVIKKIIHGDSSFSSPGEIPQFNRELAPRSTKISTRIKEGFQIGRRVKPGAREFIRLLHETDGDDIYGNTGRKFRENCLQYTRESLEKGGVLDYFTDLFMTPEGVSGVISKAQALEQLSERYDYVTHFDDDASLVRKLSPRFPNIEFVLVQDLTSGILFSEEEMLNYPNVRRIACLDADSFMQFQENW